MGKELSECLVPQSTAGGNPADSHLEHSSEEVPRYAELVSFSDDPGEAAANYFILKLMGYPDVKVLVM